ncbi:MAG: tetratricopeptide repeat protein, partial [Candidatus Methylomirabilales bacterium]
SEADRKRCEEWARAEAATRTKSFWGALFSPLEAADQVTRMPPTYGSGHALLFLILFSPVLGPAEAIRVARENDKVYEELLRDCLKPAILAQTLGPDHPDVARSLYVLANRHLWLEKHREAEPFYQLAIAILEKSGGLDDLPALAATLDDYGHLLRRMNREAEAEEMEGRAKDILAKYERENRDRLKLRGEFSGRENDHLSGP